EGGRHSRHGKPPRRGVQRRRPILYRTAIPLEQGKSSPTGPDHLSNRSWSRPPRGTLICFARGAPVRCHNPRDRWAHWCVRRQPVGNRRRASAKVGERESRKAETQKRNPASGNRVRKDLISWR